VKRPDGKRPLGRHRRRWENNFKTDFKELGWEVMGYIALAQERGRWRAVVNAVMKIRVP
jgi:hypothetical protein